MGQRKAGWQAGELIQWGTPGIPPTNWSGSTRNRSGTAAGFRVVRHGGGCRTTYDPAQMARRGETPWIHPYDGYRTRLVRAPPNHEARRGRATTPTILPYRIRWMRAP